MLTLLNSTDFSDTVKNYINVEVKEKKLNGKKLFFTFTKVANTYFVNLGRYRAAE